MLVIDVVFVIIELGRTVGYFSPLEDYMTLSSTMKADFQGGGVHVCFRSEVSGPCFSKA